jgi:hypothetical protein
MATLQAALASLVDEWKQHVGWGVPIGEVTGSIDLDLDVHLQDFTSDSSTRTIVSAIESALTARSSAAFEAADDLAEQYGSRRSLLAETTLEAFLAEIWPKAPRSVTHSRSVRTGKGAGFAPSHIY